MVTNKQNHDAIVISDLQRSFGDLRAVDGISLIIPRGKVTGFVGANGAGKTTTMRILATLDTPTSGSAHICGYDVVEEPQQVRSLLGWMPDNYGTYSHTTVVDYLDFFARAQGYNAAERLDRVRDVMEFTELTSLAERQIDTLSKGMGQRLCLGRTLIHDPEVLLLDEPAAGLDPKARVELKHLIRILANDGKTIFISSHILSELEEMCDNLLFIDKGRIVHHGSAEDLKRSASNSLLINIQVTGDPNALAAWAEMAPDIRFVEARKRGGQIAIDNPNDEILANTLKRMIEADLQITEFKHIERRLEDAFIDMLTELDQPPPLPKEAKQRDHKTLSP